MRLLPLLLLAGHVRGQHRNGFGFMYDDGLAPTSWPRGVAEPPRLIERDGICASGQHPCSDVNSTSCCLNTEYCIINNTWEAQCCAVGSDCSNDTVCDAEHYLANQTSTTTITPSGSGTVTAVSTITQAVCSGRVCSGSFYSCASSLGGHCCGFGSDCATNSAGTGICIGVSSATSSSTSITATASSSALPTDATIEHKPQGLSSGAKAGIAVGVVLIAALIIAALTFLCLRRRRHGARSRTTTTAQELPSMTPAGRPQDQDHAAVGAERHMSEVDGYSYGYPPSSAGQSRTGYGPPAQADYFGEMGGGISGAPQQQWEQQQHEQQPEHGDNVLAASPVEMGTRTSPPHGHARMNSQGSEADGSQSELDGTSSRGPSPAFGTGGGRGGGAASPVDSIAGRFELYGDFGQDTPASGYEVFHDAQENVGGASKSRVGGNGTRLPQPLASPASGMTYYETPSPLSREEEAFPRREV